MAYKTGFMVLRKFRHDNKLDFTFRNPNTRFSTSKPHAQKNMIITCSTKSKLALLKGVERRQEHIYWGLEYGLAGCSYWTYDMLYNLVPILPIAILVSNNNNNNSYICPLSYYG